MCAFVLKLTNHRRRVRKDIFASPYVRMSYYYYYYYERTLH